METKVTDVDAAHDLVMDALCDAVRDIKHDWEQSIYENWYMEMDSADITIEVNNIDPEALPKKIGNSFDGGGCDGEHHGRCNRYCNEWHIEWTADLIKVENGFATYSVCQEN
jgi:hypothetical protein